MHNENKPIINANFYIMKVKTLYFIIFIVIPVLVVSQTADRKQTEKYPYLGTYGALIDGVVDAEQRYKKPEINAEHQRRIKALLSLPGFDDTALPKDIRIERTWKKDGVEGIEYSWDVGYGPRTFAWLLRPEGAQGPLPGILALHDHGGFKTLGKEKIADGPDKMMADLNNFRRQYYGGRAFATELARKGFTVLVPDVFMWSSRKHSPDNFAPQAKRMAAALELSGSLGTGWTPEIRQYEYAAGQTERYLDQYLRLAGTNMAAVVSHEDRLSANFLVSLEQYTQKGGIGCVGLSGGGARSSLLQGTCTHIRAAVVVGMMSTYREILTRYIETHTNILFPEGLADFGDWPDVAGARSPSPLMVLYDREDQIFPLEGMQAADRRLTEIYTKSGAKDNYHGEFFPGQHKFDVEMQEIAFQWLKTKLQQ